MAQKLARKVERPANLQDCCFLLLPAPPVSEMQRGCRVSQPQIKLSVCAGCKSARAVNTSLRSHLNCKSDLVPAAAAASAVAAAAASATVAEMRVLSALLCGVASVQAFVPGTAPGAFTAARTVAARPAQSGSMQMNTIFTEAITTFKTDYPEFARAGWGPSTHAGAPLGDVAMQASAMARL